MRERNFFIIVSILILLAGCKTQDKDLRSFTIANGAEPETLDPHLMSGVPEHRIAMGIFEGLVSTDPATSLGIPGIAEKWSVSDDGTVYTFTLRKTTWSDGKPITAHDFVSSWQRMLNPETAAPYAWFPNMFLQGAEEYNSGEASVEALKVRALDDYTFQFETIGPLPYVIDALSHYAFAVVPMHTIEEHGDDWIKPENFVGNGPYVLKRWKTQKDVVLERNPRYWDKGKAILDRVLFLPVEEATIMYNMFQSKEVDWSTEIPDSHIDVIQLRPDYQSAPQLTTYYYVFQVEKPPFDDPRVRKALSMSVYRQWLIDTVLRGGQLSARSIVPPMPGYDGIDGLSEDVKKAQSLLAEAGFPDGEGFPEVTLLYNTSENHKSVAEFIQQQWFEYLGINVVLQNQEWGTYLASRRKGEFEIVRAGWAGDYPDPNTFLDMFVSGGAMNGGRYSNPTYDELIGKARTLPAGKERFAVLAEAERILIEEDVAVMPIYYYVSRNLINTEVWGGWYTNIMDHHPVGAVN